jgi:hypothetical protein
MKLAVGLFAAGVVALVGQAASAEDLVEEDGVEVWFEVAGAPSGTLALSVADDEVELVKDEALSSDVRLHFTATLPTVTVTDTRDEIPDGAFWYVMGQAEDFVGDQTPTPVTIPAANLGWSPWALNAPVDDDTGLPLISVGEDVPTALADLGSDGLSDGADLLYLAEDSALVDAYEELDSPGWHAEAELVLHTPASIAEGKYTSILTLSLFE